MTVNPSYADIYRARLAAEPIKHRLRMVQFKAQCWHYRRHLASIKQHQPVGSIGGMVDVPPELQPPPYRYGSLRGP